MTDPDICIHCRCYWRAGHTDACPQVTNVYPVTKAEDGIVCAVCHGGLVGHWTTVGDVIHCLGCAALVACEVDA